MFEYHWQCACGCGAAGLAAEEPPAEWHCLDCRRKIEIHCVDRRHERHINPDLPRFEELHAAGAPKRRKARHAG